MTSLKCAFAFVVVAMVSLYPTSTSGFILPVCPARLCILAHCPYGYIKDKNGCNTCKCKPRARLPVCPARLCILIHCPYGYIKDKNGCNTCKCKPRPLCPAHLCVLIHCQYGYMKDANGCPTCQCNGPPASR